MARYKWSSAHEWLIEKIEDSHISVTDLRTIARDLAEKLDGDQLQDLFQADMERDQYFKDLDAGYWICADCVVINEVWDANDVDEVRLKEVRAALTALGGELVSDTDEDGHDEFSASPCDCCGSSLGGARERYQLINVREAPDAP